MQISFWGLGTAIKLVRVDWTAIRLTCAYQGIDMGTCSTMPFSHLLQEKSVVSRKYDDIIINLVARATPSKPSPKMMLICHGAVMTLPSSHGVPCHPMDARRLSHGSPMAVPRPSHGIPRKCQGAEEV